MKATVLIDNISKDELQSEWGLAVYLEYNGHSYLLDTGGSEKFAKNAQALGKDLANAEGLFLSHAHYDHALGIDRFFELNDHAPLYLREGSAENCYHKLMFYYKYIGVRKGLLKDHADRIQYVSGDYEVADGVYLIPHKTEGLEKIGKAAHMYVKRNHRFVPDDFRHEQSVVLRTKKGLVILNCCSHGGADHIIQEVAQTFPDERIYALVGGFHLFDRPEAYVRELAGRIREPQIEKIITGHCTGKRSFEILKEELGDKVEQIYTGLVLEVEE